MSESRRQTFSRWTSEHKGLMLKVVRAFAFCDADRDDLFQEVAIALWKSIDSFDRQSSESTWIYKVALFTATAWTRNQRKHDHADAIDPVELGAPDRTSSDDELAELYELIARLAIADRLDPGTFDTGQRVDQHAANLDCNIASDVDQFVEFEEPFL